MRKNLIRNNFFDPELPVLISILSEHDHIGIPEQGFNTERMIRLALMHRVTGQFTRYARQHPEIFSKEQLQLLERMAKQNASLSLMQLHELIRVSREFNRKGISYACMKGPQLSRMLYGTEALKESVDLDIMLIHEPELEVVHQHLADLGYNKSNLNDYKSRFSKKVFLLGKREVHYYNVNTGCQIDLHVRAGANTYLTAVRFKGLFTNLQSYYLEGVTVPILPPEKYLVFLCYHGAMHQFSRLGWLMDIRFFIIRMAKQLDFNKAYLVARSLRTEHSLYLAMILLKEMTGDAMPGSVMHHCKCNRSIRYMVSVCKRIWSRDAAFMLSFRGRLERFVYLLMLNKGFSGKIDLLAGILIRNLLHVLRWFRL